MDNGAFRSARDEHRVHRVPGDGADLFFVAFEDAEFLHGADVENADSLVTGGTGDEVAVRGPSEGLDGVFVLVSVSLLVILLVESRLATHRVDKHVPVRGSQNFT